jgi:MtfA peptidase
MLKAARFIWDQWLVRRRQAHIDQIAARRAIDPHLWHSTLAALPFLLQLSEQDLVRLRQLCSLFLEGKEFSGAHGMPISDALAVMVAAQACLPVLFIAPPDRPDLALAWYEGFVGIVLHPSEVKAMREWIDDDGISHRASEQLTGEMVEGGPLMLAWSDVQAAGELASQAYNVVIHEFIHVMDVRDGQADGCPPMPLQQRRQWLATMQTEYQQFAQDCQAWQRFGQRSGLEPPLIDPYGGESLCEFFAVAAEAYFVQRERFAQQHPRLLAQFDGFFRSGCQVADVASP